MTDRPMKIDAGLMADLTVAPERARDLAATGLDGLFTFEGNSDVFFPLVHATGLDVDLYTNVDWPACGGLLSAGATSLSLDARPSKTNSFSVG